jgi:hypothetical protein
VAVLEYHILAAVVLESIGFDFLLGGIQGLQNEFGIVEKVEAILFAIVEVAASVVGVVELGQGFNVDVGIVKMAFIVEFSNDFGLR